MSRRIDPEVRHLEACQQGKLQTIQQLIESKAVDPNTVVEKHHDRHITIDSYRYSTDGWTPLH